MLFVRQVAAHVLGHGAGKFVGIAGSADPPIGEASQQERGQLAANNLRLAVLGWGLGWSGVWIVTANAVTAMVLLALYRASLEQDSWAPHTPMQLVALFAACVTSAIVAVASALSCRAALRLMAAVS